MRYRIDFSRIRGDLQKDSGELFEELVCQLARLQAPDQNLSGESKAQVVMAGWSAFTAAPRDHVIGYQAKYYCKPGDIDWQAVDYSVHTALTTHPDLSTYVIAVPCDFTGRRRVKGGMIGMVPWGERDRRVQKWQTQATDKGRSVNFIPWTASELVSLLTPTEAGGLRTYWFNQTEFSKKWFADRVNLALPSR